MCSGFLAYPSLIHLSSMAARTLGLLSGSGSSRDITNVVAPETQIKLCNEAAEGAKPDPLFGPARQSSRRDEKMLMKECHSVSVANSMTSSSPCSFLDLLLLS